ncbi:MAG: hypothetical protein ABI678_15705 [Kofleriaceae bacterium]
MPHTNFRASKFFVLSLALGTACVSTSSTDQAVSSGMTADSGVRGCSNYQESNVGYRADANACLDACTAAGADACEWNVDGTCFVERGSGCFVQGGFSGWYAAVAPFGGGGPPDGGGSPAPDRDLHANLERLFETYRARVYPWLGSCDAWNQLDPSQRMVFLTITHRLHTGRLGSFNLTPNAVYYPLYQEYVADGTQALDHITQIYAINGGNGSSPGGGTGSCGGMDNNRLFMQMDHDLWLAFGLANATSGTVGSPGPLQDQFGNRMWTESGDIAGPHAPFTISDETSYGSPSGQTHFWLPTTNAEHTEYILPSRPQTSGPVNRPGVWGIDDPYMLEMDQDYNWIHDSNPLCGGFLSEYVNNHGNDWPEAIDLSWHPSACDATSPPSGDRLVPGEALTADQARESSDGRFRFTYQGDGNLVLYQDGSAIWNSGTNGTSAGRTVMEADGNLVIYDASNTPIWASNTSGNPGAYLSVQSDGNTVIYRSNNSAAWSTNTCCR